MGKDEQKIEGWGMVCCASCEKPVGFFPADAHIDEDTDLELYCFHCAKSLAPSVKGTVKHGKD